MASKSVRTVLALAMSAALMGPFVGSASAKADDEGRISWSQLTKQLEDKGYKIREIDLKRDGWEAEVTDDKGTRLELRLDKNGTVVREEKDD